MAPTLSKPFPLHNNKKQIQGALRILSLNEQLQSSEEFFIKDAEDAEDCKDAEPKTQNPKPKTLMPDAHSSQKRKGRGLVWTLELGRNPNEPGQLIVPLRR